MPVAIVGAGSIGVSWAIVFARAGHEVQLHDPDPQRRAVALDEAGEKLGALNTAGLLDQPVSAIAARMHIADELGDAVVGADHVQECAPEQLDVKRALFAEIARYAGADCVLASSSSALMPSAIFATARRRERTLVIHPANPPHLLPVVELVPAPFTAADTVDRSEALLAGVGMAPVRIGHELEGFVYNRLQGAVLREAYALVRDGVIDVDGLDRIMREGLGRRWAVVGPFETSDLNARGGVAVHAERMGPAYARMGRERAGDGPWEPELISRVAGQRRALLALTDWEDRVRWRDAQLIAQERARRQARDV